MPIHQFQKSTIQLLLISILLFGCQSKEAATTPAKQTAIHPTKETVMEGLKRPWSMAFLSANEALVAEKDGEADKIKALQIYESLKLEK